MDNNEEQDSDSFTRVIQLDNCGKTLTFRQNILGRTNVVVWDASIVLASYLDRSCRFENWLCGKRVLELGAGLGCAGLTAACYGAHVVLTDLDDALPYTEKTARQNRNEYEKCGGTVDCRVLKWGKEIDLDFQPEIILVSDCVYYEESLEPLLSTLDTLLSNGTGVHAILSQEQRDTPKQVIVNKKFLEELNKRFKVTYIPITDQHPVYASSDIHLMKISKD
ncbi:protein-lysine methyltransferase METTL21D-like [Trichogramma pretiosum]|uniref:protein-lysine methyltransferase METTL21D-like n=1 Tax=Trichogramma pretiosum TaxID=7493 RepID=UPI0006C9D983|nr:protein-lysine methyltransferase METTL21D-like [Trichogramma pretiosum]